jgi:putative DNA primase/helicase
MSKNFEDVALDSLDWPRIFPFYIDSKFLGNGNKKWWSCPLCGGEETFKIYPPEKDPRGGWYCARCAKGGHGACLIHEVTNKPYREIFSELRTGNYNGGIPVQVARAVKPIVAKPEKSDEEKCRDMQNAWNGAGAVIADSPVWEYVSSRVPGLEIEWISKDVRYHPGMAYWDAYGKYQGKFPVMLLRARRADGKPRRLHRTYLTPDGKKVPFLTKKGKQRAKLEMSAPTGSIGSGVTLNTARSRTLILVEGAETGLAAVAKYRNRYEVRCMLNTNGLAQADIRWADYDHVIIYADHDKVDELRGFRPGEHYAELLATRLREMGLRVSIPRSVVEGSDFCDVWKLQYEKQQQELVLQQERHRVREETRKRNLALRPPSLIAGRALHSR